MYHQSKNEDPEQYRWRYKNRGLEELDDFSPLIDFIRFMDPTQTDDVTFDLEAEERLVTDNWLRSIAVRVLVEMPVIFTIEGHN